MKLAIPAPKSELRILGILFIIFLGFNFITAHRSFIVWLDCVAYSDPAVNLLLGQGFTSSAWYAQPVDHFWAGNTPIHQALLLPWMKVFGFNLLSVRSINYFFMILICLFTWQGVKRFNLIPDARLRILMIFLFLTTYGLTYNYQGGRHDCIGILLCSMLFYAFSLESKGWRFALIAVSGTLVPFAGMQLIPFYLMMFTFILFFTWKKFMPEIAVSLVAAGAGFLILYGFYVYNGVWQGFVDSVFAHVAAGDIKFDENFKAVHDDRNLIEKFFGTFLQIPYIFGEGLSMIPLLLFGIYLLGVQLVRKNISYNSFIVVGLTMAIVMPMAMHFTGKWIRSYAWMPFIPLTICLLAEANRMTLWKDKGFGLKPLAIAALLAAFGAGLPLRTFTVLYEWDQRDHDKVIEFVESLNLKRSDQVLAAYQTYYPIKKAVEQVYFPPVIPQMYPEQVENLNVAILTPEIYPIDSLRKDFPGEWVPGETLKLRNLEGWQLPFGSRAYNLEVYRREVQTKL